MKTHVPRRIVVLTFVLCLLVPGLIYSNGHHDPQVKLLPAKTSGTAPAKYTLTPAERDKLFTALPRPSHPATQLTHLDTWTPPVPAGEYDGPTAAELTKLERDRGNAKTRPWPPADAEPISTIELVPRPPGPEGLTEAERAKLEAWMKLRAKAPSNRGRGSE